MAVTLESLKKSVGKKNSKSKIFAWLADMELAAGDLDTALQRVNGGLTLYPNDISAKLVRAKILFQKEDFEGCVLECESILIKDTFNLAAQKIMGDAYDKLGNVAERNLCYRRYHDMDPLNKFWKDEYDVVPEAVAVAASASVAESEFSMPSEDGESLDMGASLGQSLDLGMSEPEQDDGASLFDKSHSDQDSSNGSSEEFSFSGASSSDDSLGGGLFDKSNDDSLSFGSKESIDSSFEKAFGDTFGEDDSVEEKSSPFSSSFLDDDAPTASASPVAEDSTFGGMDAASDDPFAALAAMLPNSDSSDDAAFDDLTASLDSVMESIKADDDIDKPVEEFPADDNVSGNDVTAALSDMFGLDDDLEAEEVPAPKVADFGSVVDEAAEQNASKIFESQSSSDAASDKPLSVDDAFASIFGDDELPEEMPASAPAAPVSAAPVSAPVEEPAPAVEEDSFNMSAFEKSSLSEPAWEEPAESSIFEKAASLDLNSPAVAPIEETVEVPSAPAAPAAPAADKPLSVDDAFASIFGDDELPEEPAFEKSSPNEPAFEKSSLSEPALEIESAAPAAAEGAFGESAFEKSSLSEPALEIESAAPAAAEGAFGESAFEKSALDDSFSALESAPEENVPLAAEDDSLDFSAFEKSSLSEPTLEIESAAPAAAEGAFGESAFEKSALDDSFSTLNDSFSALETAPEVEAKPAADLDMDLSESALSLEDTLSETPAVVEEPKFVAEVDVPSDPVIASPMDFMDDDSEVGTAFSSIFGDDDDLPEEKPVSDAVEVAPANTLAEQVDLAESALEIPSVDAKPSSSDIAQEMGGAFASMFGDDDDLDLPDVKEGPSVAEFVADDQQATSAAIEESSSNIANTASAETNVSDALDKSFDSLFGSDDDLDFSAPAATAEESPVAESSPVAGSPVAGNPDLTSLETEVSGAFKGLFDMEDDAFAEEAKPSSSGVDFLMSGDSDDEISAGLIKNPDAPLNRGALNLDDSMGTRTLAEIYFDQGLYADALKMYQELAQRDPADEELLARKEEIERICREKFGGDI